MASLPLVVVGSPRSGTTFRCGVINVHPLIQLTNECRVFALLKDTLEVSGNRPGLLGAACRERFGRFSRRTLGAWVERFYREEREITAPISDFLIAQRESPTPFSDPVTDTADRYVIPKEPASDGNCWRLQEEPRRIWGMRMRKPGMPTDRPAPATPPSDARPSPRSQTGKRSHLSSPCRSHRREKLR